jgi:hypothetical protein
MWSIVVKKESVKMVKDVKMGFENMSVKVRVNE